MYYYDIFFDEDPDVATGSAADQLYAIKRVTNEKGYYYHALVTEAQYNYRTLNALKCDTWSDVVSAKPKYFKKIKDKNGNDKNCPYHVFGTVIMDPKTKKIIKPSAEDDVTVSDNPPRIP